MDGTALKTMSHQKYKNEKKKKKYEKVVNCRFEPRRAELYNTNSTSAFAH